MEFDRYLQFFFKQIVIKTVYGQDKIRHWSRKVFQSKFPICTIGSNQSSFPMIPPQRFINDENLNKYGAVVN